MWYTLPSPVPDLSALTCAESPPDIPPVCSDATSNIDSLWPPNHKFVDITINGVTDPDGDTITITITGITQDEEVDGKGSGNTSPDGISGGDSAQVRAERSGTGDGRVYHIEFTADDGELTCSGKVTVGVPHDKRGTDAVDSGQNFDSTQSGPTVLDIIANEFELLSNADELEIKNLVKKLSKNPHLYTSLEYYDQETEKQFLQQFYKYKQEVKSKLGSDQGLEKRLLVQGLDKLELKIKMKFSKLLKQIITEEKILVTIDLLNTQKELKEIHTKKTLIKFGKDWKNRDKKLQELETKEFDLVKEILKKGVILNGQELTDDVLKSINSEVTKKLEKFEPPKSDHKKKDKKKKSNSNNSNSFAIISRTVGPDCVESKFCPLSTASIPRLSCGTPTVTLPLHVSSPSSAVNNISYTLPSPVPDLSALTCAESPPDIPSGDVLPEPFPSTSSSCVIPVTMIVIVSPSGSVTPLIVMSTNL